MTGNFDFLKKVDKNLFEIISEAEKLYRDEYFDQCMGQTRKFGENVCKKVLGKNRTIETTFDDMLATLKDYSTGRVEEQEFITDLYFLKKHGNSAVHSSSVKRDGMTALECIKRAFEIAINYSVYYKGKSEDILKLQYDTELMLTGTKNKSLAERYTEAKEKNLIPQKTKTQISTKKSPKTTPKNSTKSSKKLKKQSSVMVCKTNKKAFPIFWIFVGITLTISLVIIVTFTILLNIN